MILDAGFLISLDRGEEPARVLLSALQRHRVALHTTDPVVAQVWQSGARQARLASFLRTIEVHPLDDGRAVGLLLGRSATNDVVDAHPVVLALRLRDSILTGDPSDLNQIADSLGPDRPTIDSWP